MNRILIIALVFIFIQCKKEADQTYLITNTSIGKLNSSSTISDLNTIFTTDSVVKDTMAFNVGSVVDKYGVFEKGGSKLFTLSSKKDDDQKIEHIHILDARFTTQEGIGLNSTFKDIRNHYTTKKVLNTRNNIVVTFNETNVYITIDKKELPESLRFNATANIEAIQIPDAAKIKYLMMSWE